MATDYLSQRHSSHDDHDNDDDHHHRSSTAQMADMRLVDDERFSVKDRLAREEAYQSAQRVPPQRTQDTHHLMCINLSRSHFACDGATRFSDLKPESYALVCTALNACGFACDRKPRAALAKEKGRKRKSRAALNSSNNGGALRQSAVDESGDDTAGVGDTMDVEKEGEQMGGAEHLSVYIETLFDATDGGTSRVNGFRLWFFDASRDRSGLDLLTKGMQESLHEAFQLQQQVRLRLEALQKAVGRTQSSRPQAQRTSYEVARKYAWTQYASPELYQSLLNSYWLRDSLLQQGGEEQPPSAASQGPRPFTDTRAFLAHNQSQHQQRRVELNLAAQLVKEAAMVYHVESDGVAPQQRSLRCYFEPYSAQVAAHLRQRQDEEAEQRQRQDRLQRLLREQVGDAQFTQFPHPRTTYRISPAMLSFEALSEMPLPHRVGAHLYTRADQLLVQRKLREAAAGDDDGMAEEEDDAVDDRERAQPLGLDETQLEVTPGVLHQYQELLTDEMRRHLTAKTVPEQLCRAFLGAMRNQVARELQHTQASIRAPKSDLVEVVGGALGPQHRVTVGGGAHTQCFHASTPAAPLDTRHKQHLLERRVNRALGRDEDAEQKERDRALAHANVAHYRAALGRYRPAKATVEAVYEATGALKYDETFMRRDQYLVLDALNEHAFDAIDAEFLDPETGQVRAGCESQYRQARRELMEAACVEFWDEFFTNNTVSFSNQGIRRDLMRGASVVDGRRIKVGRRMPKTRFDVQCRPYHAYKLWTYAYFAEQGAINHHYKVMDLVYHAKYHHCRFYRPGCKDPKMNVVLSGQGMGGKSHRLNVVVESCPSGVCDTITHWTPQSMNVDMNMSDMLIVHEEMSNKLVGAGERKGDGAHGTSDAAQDDARNNFKERATAGQTTTLSFYVDEETGERRSRLSKCQCQGVILGATNNNLADIDPNVATRFVIVSVPRSRADNMYNRAQDMNKSVAGRDGAHTLELVEQQREVHRVYYVMECLIRSGVLGGDNMWGVEIDGAEIMVKRILDQLHTKYRVPTNDPRKLKHVLEMARTKCMASAVWFVLTSPTTRHLFHDPYTNEYLGLNPRVLLEIASHLVVTKDHVIDALTCLSSLWGHEYQDSILENFATVKCKLQELRQADFARWPKDAPRNSSTDTSPLVSLGSAQRQRPRQAFGGFGGGGSLEDQFDYDFNYIILTSKSYGELHSLLSMSAGDLCVSPNDIQKILKDLERGTVITGDGYTLEEKGSERRLVRSRDTTTHGVGRRAVVYGVDQFSGRMAIGVNIHFLKQKLPHLFHDDLIEDLTLHTTTTNGADADDEADAATTTASSTAVEVMDVDAVQDVHEKLRKSLVIERGDSNETSLLRAIRDVLEGDVLELTGDLSPEEESQLLEDYGDVLTQQAPWLTYVTSEHPAPIPVQSVFPDLMARYSATPGHRKEIALVDKPAVIQLQRRPQARPMIIYNHTTVSPLTRACLSIYDEEPDDEEGLAERAEMQAWNRDLQAYERRRSVKQRRFLLYAQTTTFRVDKDLDYIYCESHLRNMAVAEPQDAQGRLANYPPHVYQQLIDWRDEHGTRRPFLQPFIDVMDRLRVAREMIGAAVGDDAIGCALPLSKLQSANYLDPSALATAQYRVVKRRQRSDVAQEKERALALLNGTFAVSPQMAAMGELKSRKTTAPETPLEHGRTKKSRTTQ